MFPGDDGVVRPPPGQLSPLLPVPADLALRSAPPLSMRRMRPVVVPLSALLYGEKGY